MFDKTKIEGENEGYHQRRNEKGGTGRQREKWVERESEG